MSSKKPKNIVDKTEILKKQEALRKFVPVNRTATQVDFIRKYLSTRNIGVILGISYDTMYGIASGRSGNRITKKHAMLINSLYKSLKKLLKEQKEFCDLIRAIENS